MRRLEIRLRQLRNLIDDLSGRISTKELESNKIATANVISRYRSLGYWPRDFERDGNCYTYNADEVKKCLDRAISSFGKPVETHKKETIPLLKTGKRPNTRINQLHRLRLLVEQLDEEITAKNLISAGVVAGGTTVRKWINLGIWPKPACYDGRTAVYPKTEVLASINRAIKAFASNQKFRAAEPSPIKRIKLPPNEYFSIAEARNFGIDENDCCIPRDELLVLLND